jgi:hypothetical protein
LVLLFGAQVVRTGGFLLKRHSFTTPKLYGHRINIRNLPQLSLHLLILINPMKSWILLTFSLFSFHAMCQDNFLKSHEMHRSALITNSGPLAVLYAPPNPGRQRRAITKFDSSEPIQYGFCSVTNLGRIVLILRPEYGLKISAYSQEGKRVEPTREGAKYGENFDALVAFEAKAIEKRKARPPYWYGAGTPDVIPRLVRSIPAPDELFRFKEPGNYTINIELACFVSRSFPPNSNANPSDYQLIKFPGVNIPVLKK